MSTEKCYFVGVDVGTGSVRAALVSATGQLQCSDVEDIVTYNPTSDFYEQSSDNIWNACVKCIKTVVKNVPPAEIKGIGFDATCSLVVLDENFEPISVSPTGNNHQNVILWMDHRAAREAAEINSTNHAVLHYVGGKISLEMQLPKLLWLKRNLCETWTKAAHFFDLPDFLTWKATGSLSRSLCSTVCKWTYVPTEGGWNREFFAKIGLEELLDANAFKIGVASEILPPGATIPNGLSRTTAELVALNAGTAVGASIIDAHAGGLGLIGCSTGLKSSTHPPSTGNDCQDFSTRVALICGTSTCHMVVSAAPIFVPGVWGPYYSAMVPGMWLNEGGQSATGKLIDHIIDTHPATVEIKRKISGDVHIQFYLMELLQKLAKKRGLSSEAFLTQNVHIWPDFHGNRSPIADPGLRGMISGLDLATDEESLAVLYLATIQALAYGTRHILEALLSAGHLFDTLLICGGLSKSPLFVQTLADVANVPVVYTHTEDVGDPVLLGAAILGACASAQFDTIEHAISSMAPQGKVAEPNRDTLNYHEKKYQVFLKMRHDQDDYKQLMK